MCPLNCRYLVVQAVQNRWLMCVPYIKVVWVFQLEMIFQCLFHFVSYWFTGFLLLKASSGMAVFQMENLGSNSKLWLSAPGLLFCRWLWLQPPYGGAAGGKQEDTLLGGINNLSHYLLLSWGLEANWFLHCMKDVVWPHKRLGSFHSYTYTAGNVYWGYSSTHTINVNISWIFMFLCVDVGTLLPKFHKF